MPAMLAWAEDDRFIDKARSGGLNAFLAADPGAAWDGEVGEPAAHHASEPAAGGNDLIVQSPAEHFPDRPEPRPHPLADWLAPEDEAGAVASGATEVGEPEEVERLRLAETTSSACRDRTLAELDQPRLLRVQAEPEAGEPLLEIGKEPLRILPVLEADDLVIGITHDDHLAARMASPPPVGPEIVGVVEEDVGEQRARRRPLRGSRHGLDHATVLEHTRLQPLPQQADDPAIADPVLDEPDQPVMADRVEERPEVGVEDPVDPLLRAALTKCATETTAG